MLEGKLSIFKNYYVGGKVHVQIKFVRKYVGGRLHVYKLMDGGGKALSTLESGDSVKNHV